MFFLIFINTKIQQFKQNNKSKMSEYKVKEVKDNENYWRLLSANPNVTWEIVMDYSDKPWNWTELSKNPNITWEIVRDNPDKPWNWDGLSNNPNCRSEAIKFLKNKNY
jgi:hypothetical protein